MLTNKIVVDSLNGNAIFDFDYFPQEDDCLIIREFDINKYLDITQHHYFGDEFMKFHYENNCWIIPNIFDQRKGNQQLNQGKLEIE